MAWSAGEILTAANLNEYLPQSMTTWSSPIAGGITVGDGATVATYCELGPLMYAQFRFTFGSTSAVTGGVTIDLPEDSTLAHLPTSMCMLWDNSATTRYPGIIHGSSATTLAVQSINAASTSAVGAALSSTVPFTWAVNDVIAFNIWYINA